MRPLTENYNEDARLLISSENISYIEFIVK